MPEPLPPTLVEMRNSVLVRAGFSVANGLAAGYFPLVDELLRQAHNELHLEAPWLQQRKRATEALITDQSEYDMPDDAMMSRVNRVAVSDGDNEYDLVFGTGAIRNYTKTSGKPAYFEILDNVLRLYPAPSSTWTTLIFEYYAGPGALVLDADRPTLPGEPLVQRATYLLKRHTGLGGDWQADREEHVRFLNRLKEDQGEIRAIDMRPSSLRLAVKTGSNAPWREDWNPW